MKKGEGEDQKCVEDVVENDIRWTGESEKDVGDRVLWKLKTRVTDLIYWEE